VSRYCFWLLQLTVCGVQLSDDLLEEHLSRINDDAECTDTLAGECAAPSSAFRLDDPLIPELLSWISCAAILGGLAGSVAVASCCEAIGRAKGTPITLAPTSNATACSSSMDSDSEGSSYSEASKEPHQQQDSPAEQGLGKARPTWKTLCSSDQCSKLRASLCYKLHLWQLCSRSFACSSDVVL